MHDYPRLNDLDTTPDTSPQWLWVLARTEEPRVWIRYQAECVPIDAAWVTAAELPQAGSSGVMVSSPTGCELSGPSNGTVYTTVVGNNADLIARVASLYAKAGDRIADVTYGRGVFWKKVDLTQFDFLASDMITHGNKHDFRDLPYQSASLDVVVLDPPYVHNPRTLAGAGGAYRNAETTGALDHTGIIQLYRDGMIEAQRVLRPGGLLWIKCMDEIESGKQRWGHVEILEIAKQLDMTAVDLFLLVRRNYPVVNGRQKHARKNHSYLWVFRK